jgi:mannose-1-phosphate guanylyltransferase
MLLAAGHGTRLRHIEPDVPKALVSIGGEPLLARQLRYLEGQGVRRVVVNAHHLAHQVLDFAHQYRGSLELVVVVEERLMGTAGGVRNALPMLGDEPFVVLYGDVLTSEPLAPMLKRHAGSGAAATLAVYESASTNGKGTIAVDASDHVTSFREKGVEGAAVAATGPLINAGIYVLEAGFARQIPLGGAPDFGHDVFPAALARGERLAAHRLSAPVLDVGVPSALAQARREHAC